MTASSSAMMEESKQKGVSDSASKNNVGSFVKIDSISIDLADATNRNYGGKCEHFSIRRYVSEVRRKNWKLCWPFPLDGEKDKFKDQPSLLPPLTSPDFRWWSCQKCLKKIDGCEYHDTKSNNCTVISESKSDCPQILPPCTTVIHERDVQLTPKTNLLLERIPSIDCTWTDMSAKNMHQDKITVADAKAHTSFIGPENRPSDDAGHELPAATTVPVEINLNVTQEKPEYDTESRECVEARPADVSEYSRGKPDVTEVEAATTMAMSKNSTKIGVAVIPNSADQRINMVHTASRSPVLASSNEGASNANTNGIVSGLLNEPDNGSSESSEIVRSNRQGHNHSSPSVPLRRKRKVRLMTDLLFDNRDAKAEQVISKVIAPGSAVNGVPTEARARVASVAQVQVSLPDNRKEAVSDDTRKRKLPQYEERRSTEMMSSPINGDRKGKKLKDEGSSGARAASETKRVAESIGLYVQTGNRTHWSKFGSESVVVTDKKKKKRSQTTDVRPYLVPVGEYFPSQSPDQLGIPSKEGISFRAVNDASSGRGMDRIPLAVPRKEQQPISHKSKSKLPLVDDGNSSRYPWNRSGLMKLASISRDREITQNKPSTVSFRQAEDVSINTGLQLSLGDSAGQKKCGRKYTPEVGDGKSIGYCQQGTPLDEAVMKNVERNYTSGSTIPSKSGSYGFFKKRFHGDSSSQVIPYNVPALNDKQNSNSHNDGRRSLGKQVDFSGTSNYQKTVKAKELPAVPRKHLVKKPDKVSDKGPSDEIPMDVVEILAHIQYDKSQKNPDSYKRQLRAANEGYIPMPDYGKVYSSEQLRISEEANRRTNPQTRNERDGKSAKPSKRKPLDYFPNGHGDHLSHSVQKKSSSSNVGAQLADTKCSCAKNCQWNANVLSRGFFTSGVQRRECEACPIGPQPTEEAAHLWPAVVPIEMPKRYKNLPQNGTSHRSTNLQIGSSAPGLSHKSEFINKENELSFSKSSAATNLEIPGQHISSESLSRRNAAEYSLVNKHNGIDHQQSLKGSLDLYSNETIPAMHLLSLMTAGASSSSGTNLNTSNLSIGGNTRFLQRDCHPDNSSYNEYPSTAQSGVYSKSRDSVKHTLDYHGKYQLSVKPHDFFPVNPVAGPSTPSFRHERDNNGYTDRVSLNSRGKEKVQMSSSAPLQNRGRKQQSSGFSNGGYIPSHIPMPARDVQKGVRIASSSMALVPSSSMLHPLQSRGPEYTTELKLGTPHVTGAFRPVRNGPEPLVCVVNRNPADFSYPEAGNEFMIRGENLKVGKARKRRASTTNADQRKRQKNNNGKRVTDKEQG